MRPTYETESDLENERRIIRVIAERWNCEAKKNPQFYKVDYGLYRNGEIYAWAELRNRNISIDTYPTFHLSVSKTIFLFDLGYRTDRPAFIIVGLKDRILFHQIRLPASYRITEGGRKDRDDPDDKEPVVNIPWDQFRVASFDW